MNSDNDDDYKWIDPYASQRYGITEVWWNPVPSSAFPDETKEDVPPSPSPPPSPVRSEEWEEIKRIGYLDEFGRELPPEDNIYYDANHQQYVMIHFDEWIPMEHYDPNSGLDLEDTHYYDDESREWRRLPEEIIRQSQEAEARDRLTQLFPNYLEFEKEAEKARRQFLFESIRADQRRHSPDRLRHMIIVPNDYLRLIEMLQEFSPHDAESIDSSQMSPERKLHMARSMLANALLNMGYRYRYDRHTGNYIAD